MAELLAKATAKKPIVSPKKGQTLTGTITTLSPSGILVDISAKTESIVLEKDRRLLKSLLSTLKVGDTVTVSVLNPESDTGNPVVSLRRFLDDIQWKKLEEFQKKQQPIKAIVTDITKGGLLVDSEIGISGFLPNSQMSQPVGESDMANMVSKKIAVYVLELGREAKKIIFSQKPAVKKEEFEEAIKQLSVGQKIDATINNIALFGVFVSIPVGDNKTLDGLIHISELSWDEVNIQTLKEREDFQPGKKITAEIIRFDRDAKRIDLSIKRLTKDPFDHVFNTLAVDQKLKGVVTQVQTSGLVLSLAIPGADSELVSKIVGIIRKEKIPPTKIYEVSEHVEGTISHIDAQRRKIYLVPVLKEKPIGYR